MVHDSGTRWPPRVLLDACAELDVEGVVAKRVDSPYRTGVRSGDWLKLETVDWKQGHAPRRIDRTFGCPTRGHEKLEVGLSPSGRNLKLLPVAALPQPRRGTGALRPNCPPRSRDALVPKSS